MSDELRHVTVRALNAVFPWLDDCGRPDSANLKACDWAPLESLDALSEMPMWQLLHGSPFECLPTCPSCAALLDLALEMRGTKEAA